MYLTILNYCSIMSSMKKVQRPFLWEVETSVSKWVALTFLWVKIWSKLI
nr:MAG TPA: hypothetical protein [Caudoviricetes sp.]